MVFGKYRPIKMRQGSARTRWSETHQGRDGEIVDQRPPSVGPLDDTIDPRSPDEEATTRPIEDLVDL